jgi:hypothetical protein
VKRSITEIIRAGAGIGQHHRGEIHRQAADARRHLARRRLEKARRAARRPVGTEVLQPFRLDIEREDDRARPLLVMHVSVRLPRIDEHGLIVGELHQIVADRELRVGAVRLDQHMAMRMRVTHERTVHVEQRDTAESSMGDAQRCRHRGVPKAATYSTPLA